MCPGRKGRRRPFLTAHSRKHSRQPRVVVLSNTHGTSTGTARREHPASGAARVRLGRVSRPFNVFITLLFCHLCVFEFVSTAEIKGSLYTRAHWRARPVAGFADTAVSARKHLRVVVQKPTRRGLAGLVTCAFPRPETLRTKGRTRKRLFTTNGT
jgi:hypothetical protein